MSMTDQKIAGKLRTLADGMESAINGKINSGISQQNPTRRRLAIAESMRRDGEQLQRVQYLLRALADLHEAGGPVPSELARITTKAAAHTALFGYQDKIQAAVDIANGKPPEDPKAKTLRDLDRELIGCKIPGFFVTPKVIAERLVDLADIREGMEVLEPEAGRGDIAEHINHGSHLTCIEYQQRLAKILELRGFNTICGDFLEHTGAYDRVVMNPPFENFQDIAHVRHAYRNLKPGGRLVSVMGEGVFYRRESAPSAFREWLEEAGAEVIDLPAGAFQGTITSTGVKTRIVVIDKPIVTAQRKETKPMSNEEKITVQKNEQFNGIEIKFPGKPPQDVIDYLKGKGMRWNRKAGVWYAKYDADLERDLTERFVE